MSRTEELIERVRATVARSQALRERALAHRANTQRLTQPAQDRNGQLHFVFATEQQNVVRH